MRSSTKRPLALVLTLLLAACLGGCAPIGSLAGPASTGSDSTPATPPPAPTPTPTPTPSPTPSPMPHAGYFVSATGTSGGAGSIDSPWNLATALNGGNGKVQPGDTIWLRGGTYRGTFKNALNGTAAAPIVVRQYPGERATVDGFIDAYGSYTWFWGFEIAQSNPVSTSERGIDARGPGERFINLVVHDVGGSGIGFWMEDVDGEVYGCIVYNNGVHENLDHGIYTIARDGAHDVFDNVVFNNQAYGIHVYGESGQALNNVHLQGNVSFNNGSISNNVSAKPNVLVGGAGIPAKGIRVVDNTLLYSNPVSEINLRLGRRESTENQDLVVTGNYVSGGDPVVEVTNWTQTTFSGNTFIGSAAMTALTDATLSGYQWGTNTYYRDPAASAWEYKDVGYTFGGWKTATGLDATSSTVSGSPTGTRVVVRANKYERGRAHIIVNNWNQQPTVAVDVSSVLAVGDRYEVRSVQNVFGAPVASGTYSGGTIKVPMTAIPGPKPVGRSTPTPPVTGPKFDVFLLTIPN
jgi:hypothetical protein